MNVSRDCQTLCAQPYIITLFDSDQIFIHTRCKAGQGKLLHKDFTWSHSLHSNMINQLEVTRSRMFIIFHLTLPGLENKPCFKVSAFLKNCAVQCHCLVNKSKISLGVLEISQTEVYCNFTEILCMK